MQRTIEEVIHVVGGTVSMVNGVKQARDRNVWSMPLLG